MRRFLPRLITLCAIAALISGLAACVNSSKDDPATGLSIQPPYPHPHIARRYCLLLDRGAYASAEPMPMPTISCRTKLQCLLDEWW